ncbi:manganese transport system ATP-binding protein [Neomicrococcus aestuarii]|uniref:Manganese transport system ATP-binding protein n=1 Tax=Neomicrococcus aestuarii TaxID=556325 RepID=A0A7W8TVW9_9MICC|nr:metal ABC transporter ATP-binding protein [Neomicrococcus aestuarii]MBB5513879.1 manganese transport system ATP-binding protein [Neomicrococcus aestuarii]
MLRRRTGTAARSAAESHPLAIEIADLSVHYGQNVALSGVDFELPRGELCGLVGVNGSGKSTLFKSIMGLVTPLSGTVQVFGHTSLEARRLGLLSYVPQSEAVDWDFPLSVREVVMMGRYGHMNFIRQVTAADRRAVDEALERVDLTDLQHRQIGELSGGQRKRAFVARGLAQDCQLLLLDEPFAGVDVSSERLISDLLRDYAASGRTVLISTHDLAGVPKLCSSAVLLQRRVVAAGDPAAVLTIENIEQAFGSRIKE